MHSERVAIGAVGERIALAIRTSFGCFQTGCIINSISLGRRIALGPCTRYIEFVTIDSSAPHPRYGRVTQEKMIDYAIYALLLCARVAMPESVPLNHYEKKKREELTSRLMCDRSSVSAESNREPLRASFPRLFVAISRQSWCDRRSTSICIRALVAASSPARINSRAVPNCITFFFLF